MAVRQAVRISMSIPVFFQAVRLDGDVLVDGGYLNNYPIWYFDNLYENQTDIDLNKMTLGLNLLSEDERTDKKIYHGDDEIDDMTDFITALIGSAMIQLERLYVKPGYWSRTIPINTYDISGTNFKISTADKDKLIKSGYDAASKFFAKSSRGTKVLSERSSLS